MRVVVALGGNALLRRGQPLTAANQRANARIACKALAPVALEHQLVISHGNGPQVGLLALQGSAYKEVETYPLDVLDAQTEGMIGYVLQQELGNELPPDKRLATLLTQIEVDAAFANPTKPIGPRLRQAPSGCSGGGEGLGAAARRRRLSPRGPVAPATAHLRPRARQVDARTRLPSTATGARPTRRRSGAPAPRRCPRAHSPPARWDRRCRRRARS